MSSKDNQEIQDFARVLYAYLKEHCVGKETCTFDIAQAVGLTLEHDELWAVHDALELIVEEENKYEMYLGRYANMIVGIPPYIPFKFRLKKDS